MQFEMSGMFGLPGLTSALESAERTFYWGQLEDQRFLPGLIDGASADSGNTGATNVLRPGLPMGQVTSSGKLKQWDPTATDGTQYLYGFLVWAQNVHRLGADADRWVGWVHVAGGIKPRDILIPGQTTYGISGVLNEHILRAQMYPRFILDDSLLGNPFGAWPKGVVAKDDDYTITEADNGTFFTTKGASAAVNFTLPAVAERGLRYFVYSAANVDMTLTGGTGDTLIVFNDLAADSIALATTDERIGGGFEIIGDGALWIIIPHVYEAQTITVVTA